MMWFQADFVRVCPDPRLLLKGLLDFEVRYCEGFHPPPTPIKLLSV